MFFWWLNLVRLYSLCKILYPKGGYNLIQSVMGTIVSPNKILLIASSRRVARESGRDGLTAQRQNLAISGLPRPPKGSKNGTP